MFVSDPKQYSNPRIAFRQCSVFDWTVKAAEGWVPVKYLEDSTLEIVAREIVDPIFPTALRDYIARLITLRERTTEFVMALSM